MPESDLRTLFADNEKRMTLLHHGLAGLMIGCLSLVVVRFAQALVPSWNGWFVTPLALAAAVEAMYSQRARREYDAFSREWMLYRAAEGVVILVGVKLVLYWVHGFDRLWQDLSAWQEDFVGGFFDGEYLFVALLILVISTLAAGFAENLMRLEGDEKLLRLERDSGIAEQRLEARRSLGNLILMIGLGMVFLSGLLRMEWEALWGSAPPRWTGGAIIVLVYFALGMALLSLTQFAVLRVQWSLERIPFAGDLGRRWLVYSLVFLAAAALAAALLPTRYSVGLLELAGWLIYALSFVGSILLIIVLAPFFLLASLLARLLMGMMDVPLPDIRRFLPRPPAAQPPGSWEELVRSILFWLIFLGVIGFSLRHYLLVHQELAGRLARAPVLGALLAFLRRLLRAGQAMGESLAGRVQGGLHRLPRRARPPGSAVGYLSLRRLTPRQRVLFYYLTLVRRGEEAGSPRRPDQTPLEYEHSLRCRLPEVEQELDEMTGGFMEARYSAHFIPPEEAGRAQSLWGKVRKALRRPIE